MGEIILFPTHSGYCRECIYYSDECCTNKKYIRHIWQVCCVWKRCKFKRKGDFNVVDTNI